MGKRGNSCRGFTLFELVVVVVLVSFLATAAFSRFRSLQDAAEQAAVEANVAALRAALLIRSTELAAGNRWQEMLRLQRQNPFLLLETPPGNYVGEYAGSWAPGSWYYLPGESAVAYVVRQGNDFSGDEGRVLRFGLVGMNALGKPAEGRGMAYVSLVAKSAYRWNARAIQ